MTENERLAIYYIKKLADSDPLSSLAWYLHYLGLNMAQVQKILQSEFKTTPDQFKQSVINAMSDIEHSGKVMTQVTLPGV